MIVMIVFSFEFLEKAEALGYGSVAEGTSWMIVRKCAIIVILTLDYSLVLLAELMHAQHLL